MSELVIRVNLDLGARRPILHRCLLAGAMLLTSVPQLASESVTLTTYYPAPSGVYTQMITTGNTYLSRDTSSNSSQVTIGSNANNTGQQLDVYSYKGSANNAAIRATYPGGGGLAGTEFAALAHRSGFWSGLYANQGAAAYAAFMNGSTLLNGNTQVNGTLTVNGGPISGTYAFTPSYVNWNTYGTGAGQAAIYNDAGTYRTLMLVGNSSGGVNRNVSVWDSFNVNGGQYVSGSIAAQASSSCYFTAYSAGPNVVICAGGYYATLVGGFMSKYTIINSGQEPNGEALCCVCPTGNVSASYASSCPQL